MVTPTELFRTSHSAHIYQGRMYVFGGRDEDTRNYDIWCLDLSIDAVFVEPADHTFS